jgi:hypothetical protein
MEIDTVQAARSGDPKRLRSALNRKEPSSWDYVMDSAVWSGSLECVKVLYEKGYEQHRYRRPHNHPAVFAVRHGQLEILRFVVDCSGPPPPGMKGLYCPVGPRGGVEMLQYVRELGCVFNASTATIAACQGNLEALRYLHMCGAPWDCKTLFAAVQGGSLPCLEYAHMHGCPQEVEVDPMFHICAAPSLPVLRYVCEHMDSAFTAKVLEVAASDLNSKVCHWRFGWGVWILDNERGIGLDWPLVLYVGRKLGAALPEGLAEAIATQKQRAAALAGVFWKASKLLCAEKTRLLYREAAVGEGNSKVTQADAERMATWDAMARVPKELQERIAVEAHLIIL